ncbi:hypothetical protein [Saccharothrix sp. HUAS TT1]|uniref:hypothetical protein n=1 Tax=unclassified Saccharothrix TaxID=2593673 RepID=UPI00345BA0B3
MIEADQSCGHIAGSRHGRPEDGSSDVALLEAAAVELGWSGAVLPRLRLFEDVVSVFVELDHEVHAARCAASAGPVVDRTAVAMWSWPEYKDSAPKPAVRLGGVLAQGSRWQRSLRAAARFGGFGSTAVIVDTVRAPGEECLLNAQVRGVGVVWRSPDGEVRLVGPGRIGPVATARPTVVSRWLNEVLYERLLAEDRAPVGTGR